MKEVVFGDRLSYDNILYIGDEARACLSVMEDFSNRLSEIELKYQEWFSARSVKNKPVNHDKLQYHIHYHFEGGIAAFKFRDDDELPYYIQRECLLACRDLAEEQLYYAS
jgi:hypothetical protein